MEYGNVVWAEININKTIVPNFSCTLRLKHIQVHPCTGTEALYRPYGP